MNDGTMHVTPLAWGITIAAIVIFFIIDLVVIGRRPHEPSMKESGIFIGIYVSLAIIFGIGIGYFYDWNFATQFFAGWLTEYSLSIDNLFVFILIMGSLAVPRKYQQFALMCGIVLAIVLRGIFIAVGAVAISYLNWIFFIFGAFLVIQGIRTYLDWRKEHNQEHQVEERESWLIRRIRKIFPITEDYHGERVTVKINGKTFLTPMALVILALGATDLVFAVDSIPAIFGLTQEPYLVLMANVFALMGLRQLYFLLGGLMQRLVYLSVGLSVLLVFIGIKLVIHALHVYHIVDFEISSLQSLAAIGIIMAVTVIASLVKSAHDKNAQVRNDPDPALIADAGLTRPPGDVGPGPDESGPDDSQSAAKN